MARRASTIPHPLHSHQRLLAQSGGTSVWGSDPEVSVASIRGNRCRLGTRHYSVLGTAQSDPPAISVESDPDPDPAKSEARLEVSARPLRSQEALCRPGQHRAPPRLARRCCRTDLTGLSSPVIVLFQKPGPQVATRRFAFREPWRRHHVAPSPDDGLSNQTHEFQATRLCSTTGSIHKLLQISRA